MTFSRNFDQIFICSTNVLCTRLALVSHSSRMPRLALVSHYRLWITGCRLMDCGVQMMDSGLRVMDYKVEKDQEGQEGQDVEWYV